MDLSELKVSPPSSPGEESLAAAIAARRSAKCWLEWQDLKLRRNLHGQLGLTLIDYSYVLISDCEVSHKQFNAL